jgi:hypothetical protein
MQTDSLAQCIHMNLRITLPPVCSFITRHQMARSAVVCGLTCIVVAQFAGCVVHTTEDDTKKRMEERARLQTVEPSYVAHYEVSLIEVQRSLPAQARFGDMKIATVPSKGLFMAEDHLMRIVWAGPDNQLGFDLLNKSDTPVKVLWDAAAYVDITGQSRRVIHSGVKLADRNSPQAPTVIPSKGSLNDIVYPSDHVSYYGNWSQRPMFPCLQEGYICTDPERRLVAAHHGSVYRVLLPLEAGTETYEYTFVFKVNKAGLVAVKK